MLGRKRTRCAVKVVCASIRGCFFSGPHCGQSLMRGCSPPRVMLRCARFVADGRAWPGLQPTIALEQKGAERPWFEASHVAMVRRCRQHCRNAVPAMKFEMLIEMV
jgi:hypothetical protein